MSLFFSAFHQTTGSSLDQILIITVATFHCFEEWMNSVFSKCPTTGQTTKNRKNTFNKNMMSAHPNNFIFPPVFSNTTAQPGRGAVQRLNGYTKTLPQISVVDDLLPLFDDFYLEATGDSWCWCCLCEQIKGTLYTHMSLNHLDKQGLRMKTYFLSFLFSFIIVPFASRFPEYVLMAHFHQPRHFATQNVKLCAHCSRRAALKVMGNGVQKNIINQNGNSESTERNPRGRLWPQKTLHPCQSPAGQQLWVLQQTALWAHHLGCLFRW